MSTPPESPKRSFQVSPVWLGALFALAATVVWSFNFIAARGLVDSAPPCTLAFGRWLTAFCAVMPFALPGLIREWRHFVSHWFYYLAISLIGIAFFNTAIYRGAHTVPALNMTLIATTSPLFTLILARIFLGEGISRLRLLGISLAFCGVVLLVCRGDISVLASLSFHEGDLLILAASLSFSIYTLLVRKKPEGCGILSYLAVTFGLGMIMLLPAVIWENAQGQTMQFTSGVIAGLLYMGLGASLFSFWCWARAISLIGPGRSAVIYYSLPLFTGIEAVIFLGEPVLWVHFASGALILGGLLLATGEVKR